MWHYSLVCACWQCASHQQGLGVALVRRPSLDDRQLAHLAEVEDVALNEVNHTTRSAHSHIHAAAKVSYLGSNISTWPQTHIQPREAMAEDAWMPGTSSADPFTLRCQPAGSAGRGDHNQLQRRHEGQKLTSVVAACAQAAGSSLELALHLLGQLASGGHDDAARCPASPWGVDSILLPTP